MRRSSRRSSETQSAGSAPATTRTKRRVTLAAIRRGVVIANSGDKSFGTRAVLGFRRALRLDDDLIFLSLFVVDFPLILIVEFLDLVDLYSEVQALSSASPVVFGLLGWLLQAIAIFSFVVHRGDVRAAVLAIMLLTFQGQPIHPVRHWLETRATVAAHAIFSADTWRV